MAAKGYYLGAAACVGTAFLLSQVRYKEEREFPGKFAEVASEEHGHEKGLDAAEDFFGVREHADRLTWLFFALGVLLWLRGRFAAKA